MSPEGTARVTVTLARFPPRRAAETLLALGWMRLVLRRQRSLRWWRLGGVGGSAQGYGARPDWRALAVVGVWDGAPGPLAIDSYLDRRAAAVERWRLVPLDWHGQWGGADPLTGVARGRSAPGASVAVLTHGALRPSVLPGFWRRVPAVADQAVATPGYRGGFGFGSLPLVALATFSVWDDTASARQFAFHSGAHRDIVDAVRGDDWFTEDFFCRLAVVDVTP